MYSVPSSRLDGSNEGSQYMLLWGNMKKLSINYPCYRSFFGTVLYTELYSNIAKDPFVRSAT